MANKIGRSKRELKDVDLTSFMNLMVVLIPILLASAEFAKIATIDINLPEGPRGASASTKETERPEEEPNKLVLTVLVSDSAMTIGAKSGFLPSIWYQEFHQYKGIDSQVVYYPDSLNKETMEYAALPEVDGVKLSVHDREDIFLVAMEDEFTGVKMGWYSKDKGELITDMEGVPVDSIKDGEDYWALTTRESFAIAATEAQETAASNIEAGISNEVSEDAETEAEEGPVYSDMMTRNKVVGAVSANYVHKRLSAYDLLKSTLVRIRDRYPDAEDRNNLIIAAEDQIMYDKIIQLMDIGRSSNLPEISIAKLRQ